MILLAEASWGELGAWWIKGWEFAAGEFLAYHFRFLSSPVLRRCFPLIRNYRQIRTHQAENMLSPSQPSLALYNLLAALGKLCSSLLNAKELYFQKIQWR